jgi:hypothetical protein
VNAVHVQVTLRPHHVPQPGTHQHLSESPSGKQPTTNLHRHSSGIRRSECCWS